MAFTGNRTLCPRLYQSQSCRVKGMAVLPNLTAGRVVSVNIGTPRQFEVNGRMFKSAIWKFPAEGRVELRGVKLAGDTRRIFTGPE